jgi:prepilin-type processing-associated H-X9-DG protein
MLSESLNAGPWILPPGQMPPIIPNVKNGYWIDAFKQWAFRWPQPNYVNGIPTNTIPLKDPNVGLSSYHNARINVTFFDGHGETVMDDTKCWKLPTDGDDVPQLYGIP